MQHVFNPAGKRITREELKAEQEKTAEARKRRERLEKEARRQASNDRRRTS